MAVAAIARLLVALLAWVPGVGPVSATAGMTTGDAAGCSYDAPAVALIDLSAFDTANAKATESADSWEGSAPRSATTGGTSTTFTDVENATEAAGAGDALVLGKYPDYIKLADELGARRFSIPDAEWNALTPEARWVANQAVLDQAITDRIPIVLSNPATPEFLTGTYGDEIAYLIKQGYEIGPNAMSMVPKGG